MTTPTVKLVFGGAPIGPDGYLPDEASIEKTGGGKRFTIDTKTEGGFIPGGSTSETIPQHAKNSVEVLGVDKLDVFYIQI
ncbi:hypothetical protein B0H16DRAFT_1716157 [Mycena metata]|uniref:Uncharacterized protein n=1 Tax=Mycena metata TaxID=1033252 RepID=A0AAD7NNK5_9AGAR|nr:hypothetical protein B0H16DRAFT_1716157 [Mycena metata]